MYIALQSTSIHSPRNFTLPKSYTSQHSIQFPFTIGDITSLRRQSDIVYETFVYVYLSRNVDTMPPGGGAGGHLHGELGSFVVDPVRAFGVLVKFVEAREDCLSGGVHMLHLTLQHSTKPDGQKMLSSTTCNYCMPCTRNATWSASAQVSSCNHNAMWSVLAQCRTGVSPCHHNVMWSVSAQVWYLAIIM